MPMVKRADTEQSPAIGYVCVDETTPDELAVLLKCIADCCEREGLRLVRTLTDRGYDGTQLARSGLSELRTELVGIDGLVVVVPTLDHLSPARSIRSPLLLMIHRLGGRVVVATEASGQADENNPQPTTADPTNPGSSS